MVLSHVQRMRVGSLPVRAGAIVWSTSRTLDGEGSIPKGKTPMDPQLQALRYWHDLLFLYAMLMGIEAPALVFIATLMGRPRREELLALVPALVFAWALWSAKLIGDEYANAASAMQWVIAHYPHFPVTVDADAAVNAAVRTGWNVGIVTTLVLIGGWALVLRWSRGLGLPNLPGVLSRLTRPRPTPAAEPVAADLDEAREDDDVEMVVEHMDAEPG